MNIATVCDQQPYQHRKSKHATRINGFPGRRGVWGDGTFDSSDPVSMMRRQRGMISVVRRNSIVGGESDFTRAPMTPRDVRRKYSNGLDFEVVFKNGYRNNGMCAKTSAYAIQETARRGHSAPFH